MALFAVLLLPFTLGACNNELPTSNPTTSSGTTNTFTSPAPVRTAASTTKALPDLRGKGLAYAGNQLKTMGFTHVDTHDALGRGRNQFLDRDWKVCFQSPKPGPRATGTTVVLAAVKLAETCPKHDQGATKIATAGATMPDLVGKSLAVAEQALGDGASIRWRDGSGHHRPAIIPSNWQICSQTPKAGAAYGGVPVDLVIVKFGETC